MKNNKPDAALLWKQLEEDLVPRLGLNLAERVVYAYLVRQSRLEGKRQFRFGIIWLAGGVRLSQATTRYAVRGLAAKGALRLIDRTQAGHLVEVFLPGEIHAAPHEGPLRSCLGRRPVSSSSNIEEMDFFERFSRSEAIHVRPVLLLPAAVSHSWASPRPCRPAGPRRDQFLPQSRFLLRRVQFAERRKRR